jgi:phosphotransferase system enzyme I (PtsI)
MEKGSTTLKGIGVSPGICIGRAYLIDRNKIRVIKEHIPENKIDEEIDRFREAVELSKEQLLRIKDKLKNKEIHVSDIIDVHLMILEDKMIIDETISLIKGNRINAEGSLSIILDNIKKGFANFDEDYIRGRVRDIEYIVDRILRNLVGRRERSLIQTEDNVIVVAYDLSPAETAGMSKDRVLGFITDIGGKTSHTAIMARALEVPAVVGLRSATDLIKDSDSLIVDGLEGLVIINPTENDIKEYHNKRVRFKSYERKLLKYAKLPAETKDGINIRLAANIEMVEEIPSIIEHGAEGVGLYRTEFLYMNRGKYPLEEDHFRVYKRVVEKVAPYSATIRTVDIGGDKFLSHLDLAEEMNPAMGLRAIRFCLKEIEVFKTQLRAMLRASAYGNLRIMFPMVSGLPEIIKAKEILNEVKSELFKKRIPFDENIKIGIMIEVPSAVIMADVLAKEVDFFSIGTNDLIQYSLAIDRVNENVSYLYEPLHPAILRMIKNVVDAARDNGIEVGICGEMAAEPDYIPILIGFGLDELSMNAISIPRIKKVIRSLVFKETKEIVDNILKLSTTSDILEFLKKEVNSRFSKDLRS